MKQMFIWINRIGWMLLVFLIGLGWYTFWPIATQFWRYMGPFVFVHWFVLSFAMFSIVAFFYFFVWHFSHDVPFDSSLTNTIRLIGVKRWMRLVLITIIITPPYLYWGAMLYFHK